MKKLFSIFTIILIVPFLNACQNVYSSVDPLQYANVDPKNCRNSRGVYYLPKRVIKLKIKKEGPQDRQRFELEFDGTSNDKITRTIADRKHGYCLAYYDSIFSADSSGFKLDHGIIKRIYTKNNDQTAEIATKIADAAGGLAAQAAAGRATGRSGGLLGVDKDNLLVDSFEFDPFDFNDLSEKNERLKEAGYCIYLDPYNDPYIPDWMSGMCGRTLVSKPYTSKTYSGLSLVKNSRLVAPEAKNGILYKPLLTHSIVIMKRDDPSSTLPFRVWSKRRIQMPNAAPPFSLEIKRSIFADRKTDIQFDDGALKEISIEKTSEVLGAITIPIKIIQVIIDVPAQALVIATGRAKNQAELIKTNQQLIGTLRLLEKSQDDLTAFEGTLTAEQLAILSANGGVPGRNSSVADAVQRSLALNSCVQNAENIVAGSSEELCRPLVNGN